jgi:hypothetical protein
MQMIHPFTRFDFKFDGASVAAEYEDIDGILHFSFKLNDVTEFSARIRQSQIDFFVEFESLHYGEVENVHAVPQSRYKGSGLPAACVDQVMRKHPELRFVIRTEAANLFALRFAEKMARTNLYFFIL